jgi:hypothetical protein
MVILRFCSPEIVVRFLDGAPSFAYSVMVAPGSPRHTSGVGTQMPGRGSIPQRKFSLRMLTANFIH